MKPLTKIEIVNLDDLVPAIHNYRKFLEIWKFGNVRRMLNKQEESNDHKGYGLFRLFKCLLVQFMEDLSDRELERFLQENNAGKWLTYGKNEIRL